ncbi:GvpL/GvpF family gas vesicle protein [Streptomyces sp. SPB074]|uniref:GvpL/GvpF family gas vesicle protein n=1 Tax=Streptomyces sp. (strain SPB074) TaxID=465543 RepID=UPI0001D1E2A2|nr:GvpL/GvpF family gas vesicle protein [Streptomyces sp. SPB074]EFG64267.1 gas vesicle synthesis protein [Streptomyces sp. SPB074]
MSAPAPDTATYVFAVRRCGGDVHLTGHPEGAAVRLLPFGALVAVVQDVPLRALGGPAALRRLLAPELLEPLGRLHRELVHAAGTSGPTVALPVGTCYANDVRARAALEEQEERFGAALHRVTGSGRATARVERDTLARKRP